MEILSDPKPDMLTMPRFDDGAIDMQELLRRPTEQVVNAVMDAEADQLCGVEGLPGGTWPCPEIIEAALQEMAAEGAGSIRRHAVSRRPAGGKARLRLGQLNQIA